MTINALLLLILPTGFISWYLHCRIKDRWPPAHELLKMFLLGAIISPPVATLLQYLIRLDPPINIAGRFLQAFIMAALVEELIKYRIVRRFAYNKAYFSTVKNGIVVSVAVALGLDAIENILYVLNEDSNQVTLAISRILLPMHALNGAIIGYFLALAKQTSAISTRKMLITKGLLLAICFHGMFNIIPNESKYLVIPLVMGQFFFVSRLIKLANDPDSPPMLRQIKTLWPVIRKQDLFKIVPVLILLLFGEFYYVDFFIRHAGSRGIEYSPYFIDQLNHCLRQWYNKKVQPCELL